ncbi:MAG: DNA polymerase IV [Candidatus Puniceispirillales bacterium]
MPGRDQPDGQPLLCRDCFHTAVLPLHSSCPQCRSTRIIQHPELFRLALAHIDCDAFYASIEKRDNPDLLNKPVIVGGGRRGVVATACYVARIHGVRSAMPMFKALEACPDAVVIPPRMNAYRDAGMKIRQLMLELTPLVEPLSIDEAFIDLNGTEALHGMPPAASLARLAIRIKRDIGVTVSIGLSNTKSMAKIASDQDKPQGFHVIGAREAATWLHDKPVSILYGAGKKLVSKLNPAGIRTCGDLAAADPKRISQIVGSDISGLIDRAKGIDPRPVTPDEAAKSISAETTFESDIDDPEKLAAWLEMLAAKVSRRLKAKSLSGRRITVKLKSASFRTITRSQTITAPTRLADQIFSHGQTLLERETGPGRFYRLIGIGVDLLEDDAAADPPDLADPGKEKRQQIETAMDRLHDRFGDQSIIKGRRLTLEDD